MTSSRLYDRNFVLAMASQTCFVIANTLMAHYSRWIDFLGGDVKVVGAIMGTGATFGLLLRPWLGQWINRFGSKNMWMVGYVVFALSSLTNLLLVDIGIWIYLVRAILVLGGAIVFASSLTYITQTTPEDRRTEAIGILGAGGFMGMLVGPVLGDMILGPEDLRTRADFSILFWTSGLANIVPAAMLCFMRSPSNKGQATEIRLRDFFRITWRNWPGTILLVDMVFGVCMTSPFVFLAKYIDDKSLVIPGVSVIGLFFWCYAGWGLFVRVSLRRTPERLGRRKVLLVGLLFMTVGMFCFWFVDKSSPWMIVLPALVSGTGHALMFHTMTSLTIESFPHEVRGTGSALALMMLDLGMIAGAPILGTIADEFDYEWMFMSISILALVVALAYTIASIPVWRRRVELSGNDAMIELSDWIVDELTPFAMGEKSWESWDHWFAISASRASEELPNDWFQRIKANPQIEVIRLFAAAGVTITPFIGFEIRKHPLDTSVHFQAVMKLADELAESEIGTAIDKMGACHLLWAAKKRILKSEFGLDWESPADLNPEIRFD